MPGRSTAPAGVLRGDLLLESPGLVEDVLTQLLGELVCIPRHPARIAPCGRGVRQGGVTQEPPSPLRLRFARIVDEGQRTAWDNDRYVVWIPWSSDDGAEPVHGA